MSPILEGVLMGVGIFASVLTTTLLLKYRGTTTGRILQFLEFLFKRIKK